MLLLFLLFLLIHVGVPWSSTVLWGPSCDGLFAVHAVIVYIVVLHYSPLESDRVFVRTAPHREEPSESMENAIVHI